jgi:3-hydroxybutyryl-CoA dehydrogenase
MIERLCVLGAGTMGHGIAHAGLVAGCHTRLYDPSTDALDRARADIERVLLQTVSLGKLPEGAVPSTLGRLTLHDSVQEAVRDVEFIIEAAPEQLALKLDLLSRVDAGAPHQPSSRRTPRRSASPSWPPRFATHDGSAGCTSSTRFTR